MKFNGICAPQGRGLILEVHVDVRGKSRPDFISWLSARGFEEDPFSVFYPEGYVDHLTGRIRVPQKQLHRVLDKLNVTVSEVIEEARSRKIDLYTETEIVRQTTLFTALQDSFSPVLDSLSFKRSGLFGGAKADVHVEFPSGKVPSAVRNYLMEKYFYWVATPRTKYFPSEEIATLQTSCYGMAVEVFEILATSPLPGCTAIHLEQKLSMEATRSNLLMPEVIKIGE